MIKATGIVRKLDELGRVVLPIELRRTMGLGEGDPMEVFTQGDTIVLRRYEPLCVFCGSGGEMVQHRGKRICRGCLGAIAKPVPVA